MSVPPATILPTQEINMPYIIFLAGAVPAGWAVRVLMRRHPEHAYLTFLYGGIVIGVWGMATLP